MLLLTCGQLRNHSLDIESGRFISILVAGDHILVSTCTMSFPFCPTLWWLNGASRSWLLTSSPCWITRPHFDLNVKTKSKLFLWYKHRALKCDQPQINKINQKSNLNQPPTPTAPPRQQHHTHSNNTKTVKPSQNPLGSGAKLRERERERENNINPSLWFADEQ